MSTPLPQTPVGNPLRDKIIPPSAKPAPEPDVITYDDLQNTENFTTGGEIGVQPVAEANQEIYVQDKSKTIILVVFAIVAIFLLKHVLKSQHLFK